MPTSSTSEQRRPTAQAAEALRVAAIWAAVFVAPRLQAASGMLPRRASSAAQIDSQRGMREFFNGLLGLWCALSVAAFVGIGLLVQFDVKGADTCLLLLMAEALESAARQGFDMFIVVWLGTWVLVAAVICWCLQCIMVLIFDWGHEKPKPLA